ncbi:hypothetical protein [Pseudofrankia sp. BMG5.36]|uniref:hypothetical protein n=1 Tax=Pseudofrankia sp. BMG5.36 TaxID=1834512 RepID=UPI0008DAE7E9|nr:hypothetical protein [Pseudofrankia sp. BMG5.36]OHV61340.1 hypothetical protein BCD48_40000 [Pseudofrankia sp. BMG5.36]
MTRRNVTAVLQFPGSDSIPPTRMDVPELGSGDNSAAYLLGEYRRTVAFHSPDIGLIGISFFRVTDRCEIWAVFLFEHSDEPSSTLIYHVQSTVRKLTESGDLPPATRLVDLSLGDTAPRIPRSDLAVFAPRKGKFPAALWCDSFLYYFGRHARTDSEWKSYVQQIGLPFNRIVWRKATKVSDSTLEYSHTHVTWRASNGDKLLSLTNPPARMVQGLRRHGNCLIVSSRSQRPVSREIEAWLRTMARDDQVAGGSVRAIESSAPPDVRTLDGCSFIASTGFDDTLRRRILVDSNILVDLDRWFYRNQLPEGDRMRLQKILLAIAGDDIIPGLAIYETCSQRLGGPRDLEGALRLGHASRVVASWAPDQILEEFTNPTPAEARHPLQRPEQDSDDPLDESSTSSFYELMQAPVYAALIKIQLLLLRGFSGPDDRVSRFQKFIDWMDSELDIVEPLTTKIALNAFFGSSDDPNYVQRLLKPGKGDIVHATWGAMWDLSFLRFLAIGGTGDPTLNNNLALVTCDRALIPLHQTCGQLSQVDPGYIIKIDISPRWDPIRGRVEGILSSLQERRYRRNQSSLDIGERLVRAATIAFRLEQELGASVRAP